MKHLKKLASVLLALVMAAALMMPAFAADTDPTITISQAGLEAGHTYVLYQLFQANPVTDAEGNLIANNVESSGFMETFKEENFGWGYSLSTDTQRSNFISALNTQFGLTGEDVIATNATALDVAKKLSTLNGRGNYEEALGAAAAAAPVASSDDAVRTISSDMHRDTLRVPTGYYLIQETYQGSTRNILNRHVANETISPKITKTPGLDKKVETSNGSDTWADSADYSTTKGEDSSEVNFRIAATIPDTITGKTEYSMTIFDRQQDTFTLDPNSVRVYYLEPNEKIGEVDFDTKTPLTAGTITSTDGDYALETNATRNGQNYTFVVEMKNMVGKYEANGQIVVMYTSTLDEDAVLGTPGNKNDVWLDYTDREGDIPHDDTTVYTFELDITKIDGDESTRTELEGAEFTLYEWTGEVDNDVTEDGNWKEIWKHTNDPDGETARFEITGLKTGKYKLVEDTAPTADGKTYNKIEEPIYLSITAEYTEDGVQKLTIQECKDDWTALKNPSNSTDDNKSSVDMDVVNNSGVLLPETGGIGTTIFYIVGGLLVVGAVVLLITKRRAGADEE